MHDIIFATTILFVVALSFFTGYVLGGNAGIIKAEERFCERFLKEKEVKP